MRLLLKSSFAAMTRVTVVKYSSHLAEKRVGRNYMLMGKFLWLNVCCKVLSLKNDDQSTEIDQENEKFFSKKN
jgi:hypothetical protein